MRTVSLFSSLLAHFSRKHPTQPAVWTKRLALRWACAGAASLGLPVFAATPKLLVLGDSLSAEYGLPRGQGWVALLEHKLKTSGHRIEVVNASISGDTTSGGRSRLPALLKQPPRWVIIELGGNDALRGLPLKMTESNLRAMVQAAKQAGAKVLVLGMQMPPNYGAQYARDFNQLFKTVADSERVARVPFFLAPLMNQPNPLDWFQADRIHPTARAQPLMLDAVWPHLQPLL